MCFHASSVCNADRLVSVQNMPDPGDLVTLPLSCQQGGEHHGQLLLLLLYLYYSKAVQHPDRLISMIKQHKFTAGDQLLVHLVGVLVHSIPNPRSARKIRIIIVCIPTPYVLSIYSFDMTYEVYFVNTAE